MDSNVLLWSLSDQNRLTPKVLQLLEDESNDLFLSRASLWELAIKVAKGKLELPGFSVRSVIEQVGLAGIPIFTHNKQFKPYPVKLLW